MYEIRQALCKRGKMRVGGGDRLFGSAAPQYYKNLGLASLYPTLSMSSTISHLWLLLHAIAIRRELGGLAPALALADDPDAVLPRSRHDDAKR
jgi:hypothetical protein